MNIVRGILSTLIIWHQLEINLCEEACNSRTFRGCIIDVINMTSGDGVKLLRTLENEEEVYIGKLVVAISPAGVFLQKISHLVTYVTYTDYQEPTFNLPEGNTISEILIMHATSLRAFVAGPSTRLESLNIQQCMLDRLPQTLPKMTMMKRFFLTNCLLSVLRLDMLVENQNLITLDLSYNQIRQIFPVTAYPGRTLSIKGLILNNNQLERLDMSVFASVPKLEVLHIVENRLTRLESTLSISLPFLNTMYFMFNLIEIFDLRNLTLPNLSMLSLSGNALKQMPSLSKMLPELVYIAVTENNLTRVDLSYFRPYRKLKDIYLSSNQITAVRTSSPVTLPVRRLDLGNNRISVFNITGCGFPNMTSLNLKQNRLTMIPPVFDRFPKVSLIMDGNPITCDTLLPYKDKIENGKLYKDQIYFSQACDTTSSFLVGEKIKVCCNN